MRYPQFIDNNRRDLATTLRTISTDYEYLSIATGYWDLPGTLEIIDEIENYKNVRILIGQEPLAYKYQKSFKVDLDAPENVFPDADIKKDLEDEGNDKEIDKLRYTLKKLVKMIKDNRLKVKIFRQPRLHAKAYIFGKLGDGNSVGIIGSSNFTKAGLTRNSELNFLTDDYKIVEFEPKTENQENGHLKWFEELWEAEEAIEWTGDFTEILQNSPIGEYTYGPYDVYIRTLMEVFPDELIEINEFDKDIKEVLHPFQEQNALSLKRKLESIGVAMLSDSVGLGKTITAAAIIKQYIAEGKNNIVIIPPAALISQWSSELQCDRWELVENRDFQLISQQDSSKIRDLTEKSIFRKNTRNEIDLFVIDEAHNLRSQGSSRYQEVLSLLQENPSSKVLLLTATPINNSLMDFANQIQLGSKGDLVSVNVPYKKDKNAKIDYIDFFEALKRIQSEARKAEKNGEDFNWEDHKHTLMSGIRHYLVRSTRQGIEKRNAIEKQDTQSKLFPSSKITQFTYEYEDVAIDNLEDELNISVYEIFEGLFFEELNIDLAVDITQRTMHPIDIFDILFNGDLREEELEERFNISKHLLEENIFNYESKNFSVIPLVFKIINFLGFVPYRPEVYNRRFYGQSIKKIREFSGDQYRNVRIQMAIHNMLHVTWLKRLESSTATLLKSVENYIERIEIFEKWLNKGYLISLTDAELLSREYDEDLEKASEDYLEYLKELEYKDENEIKKRGVEKKFLDDKKYNIEQMRIDIQRDKDICRLLKYILKDISSTKKDMKLKSFVENLKVQLEEKKYGEKILVFSFFSDTIDYLSKSLPKLFEKKIEGFEERSAFVTGGSKNVENITNRFSPHSKKYKIKNHENEIDFLFATDVLSEGQNLQDAGILINYDLHWNPVRMIQRNGRINRLGSTYDEILIANARPNEDLELYLKIVRKLESKIATINNTIGNDQSILGENENPIEFNDLNENLIFSMNSEEASKAFKELDEQTDVFDWADEYALELRQFLDENKESKDMQRILNIPLGKWNLLPQNQWSQKLNEDDAVALFKVKSENGKVINEVGFVQIDSSVSDRGPFSNIKAKHIQEHEALKFIRTTKDDNERKYDKISFDRHEYIETGKIEISTQFEKSQAIYKLKPGIKRRLIELEQYLNSDISDEINLLSLIQNGIKRSNEKREFERIMRDINKQIKKSDSPYERTVKEFEKFIITLRKNYSEKSKIESIEGVLYYVR